MSDDGLMRKEVRLWKAAIVAVLGLLSGIAGGGGAGTWTATAQVEERLRDQEVGRAEMKTEMRDIKEDVQDVKNGVRSNRRKINEIDKKVERAVTILERLERRVE